MTIDDYLVALDKVQSDLKATGRYKFPRKNAEREVDCDTDKLYGRLDVAIQYLKDIQAQYPDAELEEKWTGYETMYMRFVYITPETDEEYQRRLYFALHEQKRMRKDRDERNRKRAIEEKIAKLKAQL
jgi:hypothetical protein